MKVLPDYVMNEVGKLVKPSWYRDETGNHDYKSKCLGIYFIEDYVFAEDYAFTTGSVYHQGYITQMYLIILDSPVRECGGTALGDIYEVDWQNEYLLNDDEFMVDNYGKEILERIKDPTYFWTEDQIKTLLVFS